MSKSESKKRIIRRKINRKISLISNIIFFVAVIITLVVGGLHLFTKKKEYRALALEQYNSENYNDAIQNFDKALKCNQWFSDSVNVDICLYKAEAYIRTEQYQEAYDTYNLILKKYSTKYYNEEDIKFMINLSDALIQYAAGNYITSVVTFCDAVDKGYYRASIFAAICYNHLNEYDNMIKYYDIYKQYYGANTCLYYQYASYYSKNKDYEKALTFINDGLCASDTVYIDELKYLQILCYTELQNFDEAYKYAKEFVELYPNDDRGRELFNYVDSRVNKKTKPINDIFGVGGDSSNESEVSSDNVTDDNDEQIVTEEQ